MLKNLPDTVCKFFKIIWSTLRHSSYRVHSNILQWQAMKLFGGREVKRFCACQGIDFSWIIKMGTPTSEHSSKLWKVRQEPIDDQTKVHKSMGQMMNEEHFINEPSPLLWLPNHLPLIASHVRAKIGQYPSHYNRPCFRFHFDLIELRSILQILHVDWSFLWSLECEHVISLPQPVEV